MNVVRQLCTAIFCSAAVFTVVTSAIAGPVTWNKGGTFGNNTYNLNSAANWNGGFPANGSNVFIVLSSGSGSGWTQTITNSPVDKFFADSLSITNVSTKGDLVLTFSGEVFLTNGVGQLNVAGVTADQNLTVTLSSNLFAKSVRYTGGTGTGVSTLNLNGSTAGDSLLFNASSGNNFLWIRGALSLSDALTVTNLGVTSAGTISGNATVGRLVFNNAANTRLTISNSTVAVTGAVASVVGGFTLANSATISLTGSGGLTISNVSPVIQGTIAVGTDVALESKVNWSNFGTVTMANGYLIGSATLTNTSSGQIRGSGGISNNIVNIGSITATNGELRLVYPVIGAGSYTAKDGATLTFVNGGSVSSLSNPSANLRLEGVLTNTTAMSNQGTIIMAGGRYHSLLTLTNPSGSVIKGSGTVSSPLANSGTIDVLPGTLSLSLAPVQTGRINISGSGTLAVAQSWSNSGVISNMGGTVATTGTLTNLSSGSIVGNGALIGNLVNHGTLSPGFSAGAMAFTGDLTLGSSGTLLVELASLSSFDNLSITGTLVLGGTLDVTLLDGYNPSYPDSWTIITTTDGVTGSFDTVTPGYSVSIDGNTVVLQVIPEPGPIGLVCMGLLSVVFIGYSRRRRP